MKTHTPESGILLGGCLSVAAWAVLLAGSPSARAQPAVDPPAAVQKAPGGEPGSELLVPHDGKAKWVLGLTLSSTPSYTGAADRSLGLRPVLAARVGRWMVSTSSARRMAGMPLAGGISTTVATTDRWQLGVGLRLTHGRQSADNALLEGLPDVSRSVALRVAASWALAPDWRITGSLQQALQHSQGLNANVGLGWSRPLDAGWTLDASTGLTWANAGAMRTFYGVPLSQSRPGRGAWLPGAGLEQWHWGVGLSRALTAHWRLSTSLGRSTLLGAAAQSPLTVQRRATTAQVSLAYVGW